MFVLFQQILRLLVIIVEMENNAYGKILKGCNSDMKYIHDVHIVHKLTLRFKPEVVLNQKVYVCFYGGGVFPQCLVCFQ